jgi:hypothetical protein
MLQSCGPDVRRDLHASLLSFRAQAINLLIREPNRDRDIAPNLNGLPLRVESRQITGVLIPASELSLSRCPSRPAHYSSSHAVIGRTPSRISWAMTISVQRQESATYLRRPGGASLRSPRSRYDPVSLPRRPCDASTWTTEPSTGFLAQDTGGRPPSVRDLKTTRSRFDLCRNMRPAFQIACSISAALTRTVACSRLASSHSIRSKIKLCSLHCVAIFRPTQHINADSCNMTVRTADNSRAGRAPSAFRQHLRGGTSHAAWDVCEPPSGGSRLEVTGGRALQHSAVGSEPRAMQGAIPGLLQIIEANDAAQVRTDG